jgi:hypothetical protein
MPGKSVLLKANPQKSGFCGFVVYFFTGIVQQHLGHACVLERKLIAG